MSGVYIDFLKFKVFFTFKPFDVKLVLAVVGLNKILAFDGFLLGF